MPDVINGDSPTRKYAIILSPLPVEFGLNIQAANHIIHFTRSWNPAKETKLRGAAATGFKKRSG